MWEIVRWSNDEMEPTLRGVLGFNGAGSTRGKVRVIGKWKTI